MWCFCHQKREQRKTSAATRAANNNNRKTMMRMNVRSIPGSKNRTNNATGAGWKCSQDGRTAQVETARLLDLHRHFLCVRIILCDVNERTGGKIAAERLCRIAQLRRVALHDKTRQACVTSTQNIATSASNA